MSAHGLTEQSQLEFDMDDSIPLSCVCGVTGNSDAILDHIALPPIEPEHEDAVHEAEALNREAHDPEED